MLLFRLVERILLILQLSLHPPRDLQVAGLLRRQQPRVAPRRPRTLASCSARRCMRGLQLTLRILVVSSDCCHVPSKIFIDEELRELGGDLLGKFRSWRGVRNIECRDLLVSVPDKLDHNIVTHPLYFFVWIEMVVAAGSIKVQLLNYMKETGAADISRKLFPKVVLGLEYSSVTFGVT